MSLFNNESLIDYNRIRLYKSISELGFITIFSRINLNYFTMNPGFIDRCIFKKILVCYLDIYNDEENDNDSNTIVKQSLHSNNIPYRNIGVLKLHIDENNEDLGNILEKYSLQLLLIDKKDLNAFEVSSQRAVIYAFNHREVEYFLVVDSLLKLYMNEIYEKEPSEYKIANQERIIKNQEYLKIAMDFI